MTGTRQFPPLLGLLALLSVLEHRPGASVAPKAAPRAFAKILTAPESKSQCLLVRGYDKEGKPIIRACFSDPDCNTDDMEMRLVYDNVTLRDEDFDTFDEDMVAELLERAGQQIGFGFSLG